MVQSTDIFRIRNKKIETGARGGGFRLIGVAISPPAPPQGMPPGGLGPDVMARGGFVDLQRQAEVGPKPRRVTGNEMPKPQAGQSFYRHH